MHPLTIIDAVPTIRPGVESLLGAPQLTAGGMNLTLDEEELAARRSVALPYERQQVCREREVCSHAALSLHHFDMAPKVCFHLLFLSRPGQGPAQPTGCTPVPSPGSRGNPWR